ncbi:MAG: hypothetical protein SPI77_02910 [Corynebacterium sp.]|nr:hypothetical protein [Corynebacterium sp.]
MIQFVVGAAAGYILGTKAGRKRYEQIKSATQTVLNSPVTKKAVATTRRTIANKLDPQHSMKEVKDLRGGRRSRGTTDAPQVFEPDDSGS